MAEFYSATVRSSDRFRGYFVSGIHTRKARKTKTLPPAIFQINAVSYLVIAVANGLRETNPEWHHNFLVQLINALTIDPDELQRLIDGQAPKLH